MPRKPMKPCKHRGCPLLTHSTFCEFHVRLHVDDRPSASRRGYDKHWRAIRKSFLKRNPLCESCLDRQQVTQANEVHHIKPLREGGTHDDSNLMALCHSCHSKITRQYRPTYTYKTTPQGR
jgi:5-methylcytosine-specific restriction enzyme A